MGTLLLADYLVGGDSFCLLNTGAMWCEGDLLWHVYDASIPIEERETMRPLVTTVG
jgi:hypothetical protein